MFEKIKKLFKRKKTYKRKSYMYKRISQKEEELKEEFNFGGKTKVSKDYREPKILNRKSKFWRSYVGKEDTMNFKETIKKFYKSPKKEI